MSVGGGADVVEDRLILQGISLLHTHEFRRAAFDSGKSGKQVRPISAKRADVLQLPLSAWKQWAGELEGGFRDVARFLRRQYFLQPAGVALPHPTRAPRSSTHSPAIASPCILLRIIV